jgi:hypothetical protein
LPGRCVAFTFGLIAARYDANIFSSIRIVTPSAISRLRPTAKPLGEPIGHARAHHVIEVMAAVVAVGRNVEFDVRVLYQRLAQALHLGRWDQAVKRAMQRINRAADTLGLSAQIERLFEIRRRAGMIVIAGHIGEPTPARFPVLSKNSIRVGFAYQSRIVAF